MGYNLLNSPRDVKKILSPAPYISLLRKKKNCFGEIMFKMCFRTYRTQKIYSPKQIFFFVNNEKIGLPRRLCGKKKLKKILFLKCVSEPIEPKKYIHQNKFFFFVNNEKIGLPRRLRKKKLKKMLCLKCVSEPIEPKKYIHQNNFFFR